MNSNRLIFVAMLLAAAFVAWLWFDSGAGGTLAGLGRQLAGDRQAKSPGGQNNARDAVRQNLVVVSPAGAGIVNDRLSAIGSGRALRTVSIRPLVTGQIIEIDVAPGAAVEKGAVIARLDSRAEEIARDRALLAVTEAEKKFQRFQELYEKKTVTVADYEEARTALDTARLAHRQAELDFERRSIFAPFDGITGLLNVHEGDFVTTATEITVLDDRKSLLIDFTVPERYARSIQTGAPVSATAIARPGETFAGSVSAIDNRIDTQSRTLRVQAQIANSGDRLRAGMSFQVTMRFPGDRFPSVDPLAIQWDSQGSFVWVMAGGRAEKRPAAIVQRNADSVLVNSEIAEGDSVIIEGVQGLRPGSQVKLSGETDGQTKSGTGKPAKGS